MIIKLSLLLLLLLIKINNGYILNTDNLYKGHELNGFIPFGTKYGDKIMLKNDDGHSGPHVFPFEFPFFKTNITLFYINTNVLISFEQPLDNFYDILLVQPNVSYICPFWTDIDTRYNGDIFHREIKDQIQKNEINNEINEFMKNDINNFQLKFAYLVTWLKVGKLLSD